MICVRKVDGKGRGVFAQKRFAKGEMIERAPVVVIPSCECPHIEKTTLDNYCFRWGPNWEGVAIALGFGSLYNHSYAPNAQFVTNLEDQVIEFIALRKIGPDEEITINYNSHAEDQSPVWFEVLE